MAATCRVIASNNDHVLTAFYLTLSPCHINPLGACCPPCNARVLPTCTNNSTAFVERACLSMFSLQPKATERNRGVYYLGRSFDPSVVVGRLQWFRYGRSDSRMREGIPRVAVTGYSIISSLFIGKSITTGLVCSSRVGWLYFVKQENVTRKLRSPNPDQTTSLSVPQVMDQAPFFPSFTAGRATRLHTTVGKQHPQQTSARKEAKQR